MTKRQRKETLEDKVKGDKISKCASHYRNLKQNCLYLDYKEDGQAYCLASAISSNIDCMYLLDTIVHKEANIKDTIRCKRYLGCSYKPKIKPRRNDYNA